MHKIAFLSLSLLFTSSAMAAQLPNLYVCEGKDLKIVYTTSGMTGHGTLQVDLNRPQSPIHLHVDAAELTKQNTVIGDILSAYVGAIPDLSTTYASIVLPRIHLAGVSTDNAVEFHTQLVVTTKKTSFGGPELVTGLVDDSFVAGMKCSASFVHF
jgi:hypothetical protein